jgi:hypothetical protein
MPCIRSKGQEWQHMTITCVQCEHSPYLSMGSGSNSGWPASAAASLASSSAFAAFCLPAFLPAGRDQLVHVVNHANLLSLLNTQESQAGAVSSIQGEHTRGWVNILPVQTVTRR